MRVGIDVAGALTPPSGIGRYTTALYRALSDVPDLTLVPFCNGRGRAPSLDPADEVVNPRWPARVLNASWARFGWPSIERYTGPLDVFHTSDWSHPPLRGAARVTTVHDLGPVLHPEWYAPEVASHHARHNRATARHADRIVAISDYTRRTFIERYPEAADRVAVVPHGVDPLFAPASKTTILDAVDRHGVARPYLLYVGTRERRKNLKGLVDVFVRVADRLPDIQLVVVGARPWVEGKFVHGANAWSGYDIEERIGTAGLGSRVSILGSVPLADLIALYSGAEAFVFPTLFEGFGLPVLEAMACGCPVVASANTALPEVVGAAGLLVSPRDLDAFAGAVCAAVDDSEVRSDLVAKGQARAAEFTWMRTASMTAEAYRAATVER